MCVFLGLIHLHFDGQRLRFVAEQNCGHCGFQHNDIAGQKNPATAPGIFGSKRFPPAPDATRTLGPMGGTPAGGLVGGVAADIDSTGPLLPHFPPPRPLAWRWDPPAAGGAVAAGSADPSCVCWFR